VTDTSLFAESPRIAVRLLVAARDLATARDVAAVAAITCAAARELIGADGTTFVLRDGQECVCADENANALLWKGCRFPAASSVAGWVMEHREPAVIPDVLADARVPQDICRPTIVRSVAAVPVGTSEPVAAIGAYWTACHHATTEEIAVLKLLAANAALALDNARLFDELHAAMQGERDARLAAESARRTKDEVLVLVAHELRQPLHASLAAVTVMTSSPAGPADAHAVLRRQLEQMTRLVDDLVDATSVVYARVDLALETVHVPSLITEVSQGISPFMQERRLQFEAVPPVRPAWIRVDVVRIRQVLMNLLMNAAKYTDPGGAVRLSAHHNDGSVTISVRDNGRGIDPEFLPHVFDLFTSGGGERAGFGLGLSVARRLVELHHGRLEARSAGPGAGSEFIITLPTMATD